MTMQESNIKKNTTRDFWYIHIIVLLFLSLSCNGQDTTNVFAKTWKSIDSKIVDSKNSNFKVIPAPVFNPTFGTGIAVLPVYVFHKKGVSSETNPSILQGIIFISSSGSYLAGIKQTIYFNNNKYWLDSYAGYASMEFDFLIKNNTQKEKVYFKGFISNASFSIKMNDHWFLGPMLSVNYLFEQLTKQAYITNRPSKDFELYLVPGLKATHDSRDNIFYPQSGWLMSLSYESLIHNDSYIYNFDKIILRLSNYSKISREKDLILASHIFTQIGIGILPLHEMASAGESSILRGYHPGNYINDSMISTQCELRWMFKERWGTVAFIGYGWLFDEPRHIGRNIHLPSIGSGLRYRLFPSLKLNLGLDVAFGRDGNANVYVKISEAF